MANTKIYKSGGIVYLEIDGQTDKEYVEEFDLNIVGNDVIFKDLSNKNAVKNFYMTVAEVQKQDGTAVGDKAAVEKYLSILRQATIDFLPVDYQAQVPLGNVPGQSGVNKFGANSNIAADTTEDVWDGGGDYSYPAWGTAPITNVVSSNAADAGNLEVQGLDVTGELVIQTVVLNGTTAVTLTTPLWRIFRMKNKGTVDYVGIITADNAGLTTTYAIIQIGNNQTLMALYTVPLSKTALLTKYYCTVVDSTNKSPTSTRFRVLMRENIDGIFQLKHVVGIPKLGNMVEHSFNPYVRIAELVDIRISASPVDEAADVASGFDIVLVDDDEGG